MFLCTTCHVMSVPTVHSADKFASVIREHDYDVESRN
jgi:hypothetical protein